MFWSRKPKQHVPSPEELTARDRRRAELIDRLALLGRTPREIAENLFHLDVQGVSDDDELCPISNWLRRQYNTTDVHVGTNTVRIPGATVPTPGIIAEFLHEFDNQIYPQLEWHKRHLGKKQQPAACPDLTPIAKD